MVLEGCFSPVRLKVVNDGGCRRREVANRFPVSRVGLGLLRPSVDRETGLVVRGVCSKQSQLPSQVVQTRAQSIVELSGQTSEVMRGVAELEKDLMKALVRIVLSPNGVGMFPKLGFNVLEFF